MFAYIPSRVALDKTPSTSGREFKMKSPTSIDSFEKDSNPGSDGITQAEIRQLRRIGQKKQLIASNLPPFSKR